MGRAAPASQVRAARETVLAVPEPDLGVLTVTGKDRESWLNGLVTCNLAKGTRGEARYGLVVVRTGRVMVDLVVLLEPERAWIVAPSAQRAVRARRAPRPPSGDDGRRRDRPDAAFEVWSLHGPRSGEVVDAARAAGAVGAKIDRTELGGGILVLAAEADGPARAAMAAALRASGGVSGDADGWEALRLERSVPRFGVDFDDKTYPQEAGLEKTAVSFDKGCYLGQEVVCMLELRGHVKRKLVPLVLDGDVVPERGALVTDGAGAAVGEVTSAASSPTLGRAVALAMLKRAQTEPGTRVVVGGRSAEVVQRPA